jgi:hypothetical protein
VYRASILRRVEFFQRIQSTDANFCLRIEVPITDKESRFTNARDGRRPVSGSARHTTSLKRQFQCDSVTAPAP